MSKQPFLDLAEELQDLQQLQKVELMHLSYRPREAGFELKTGMGGEAPCCF